LSETLDEYMTSGFYTAVPEGSKIKILEKSGGYTKFLIMEGFFGVGEEYWTFKTFKTYINHS